MKSNHIITLKKVVTKYYKRTAKKGRSWRDKDKEFTQKMSVPECQSEWINHQLWSTNKQNFLLKADSSRFCLCLSFSLLFSWHSCLAVLLLVNAKFHSFQDCYILGLIDIPSHSKNGKASQLCIRIGNFKNTVVIKKISALNCCTYFLMAIPNLCFYWSETGENMVKRYIGTTRRVLTGLKCDNWARINPMNCKGLIAEIFQKF